MNVTATTLPRRSRRDSRASSCVVSVNGAAGPILERCWAPLASWPGARPGGASDAGGALRFQCADLVGLHDRPQGALGCHRVLVDKVVVGHHPTAEVL